MRGMKKEERGRKMDRESDDFEERGKERGEQVMFFFLWLNENRGFRGEMDVWRLRERKHWLTDNAN